MKTSDLSSGDLAVLMGVTRQAVDRWLTNGPPSEQLLKIGAVVEIADVLAWHPQPSEQVRVVVYALAALRER